MTEADLIRTSNEIHTYAALLLKFFNQALEERLHAYGTPMTGLQFSVLGMLQRETLTISAISQRLGMDPSTLVRIVDALERKGLAVRGVSPDDRRRNPIEITAKGRELIAAVPLISEHDPTFQAIQSLGPEQARLLCDLLRHVIRQFPEGRMLSDLMSDSQ
jgi:DNA-binding MarR family transcriptional regulator